MKLSPVLLAAVSADQSLVGPSSQFDAVNAWPVQCNDDRECSAEAFKNIGGDWNRFPVEGLMCNKETKTCGCKPGRLDADDNAFSGCELEISDECQFGSCEEHGVQRGQQCGKWKLLQCNGKCCELSKEEMPDFSALDPERCEEQCKRGCSVITDAAGRCTKNCVAKKCKGIDEITPVKPVKPDDPVVNPGEVPTKPDDPVVNPGDVPTKPDEVEDPVIQPGKPTKPIVPEGLTEEEKCAVFCDKRCDGDDVCFESCNKKCLNGDTGSPIKPITEIDPGTVEVDDICELLCEKKCAQADNMDECMGRCSLNCNSDDITEVKPVKPDTGDETGKPTKPDITEIKPEDVEIDDICALMCDKKCHESDDPKCAAVCAQNCQDGDMTEPVKPLPVNCEDQCEQRCSEGPDSHKCMEKCLQTCEDFNTNDQTPTCETIRCMAYSECVEFDGKGGRCVCIDGYGWNEDRSKCICKDDWCQDMEPTIRPPIVEDNECDLSILGSKEDGIKADCRGIDCYVKCRKGVPFFGEVQVDSLMCWDGNLYTVSFDEMPDLIDPTSVKPISVGDLSPVSVKPSSDKPTAAGASAGGKPSKAKPSKPTVSKPDTAEPDVVSKPDRILVDGPLDCRAPEVEPIKNPCKNENTFKCPRNSSCHPSKLKPFYTCECNDGYYKNGRVCEEIIPIIPIEDDEACPLSFKKSLRKLKISNLKNPIQYEGTSGSKLIQIETQIKNLALNSLTYTGFLEFNLENCGKAFIKAFSSNLLEFAILDAKNSRGLYSVQGQKAVFFKDKKGSASKAGGVIQFTKNYKTLGQMTGNKGDLEINQRLDKKTGRYSPGRDTFLLAIQGDVISPDEMGEKEFAKCFNPKSLQLSIVGEKDGKNGFKLYTEDYTECYYKSKLSAFLDSECKSPAVVDGEITEDFTVASVLFNSDFAECSQA